MWLTLRQTPPIHRKRLVIPIDRGRPPAGTIACALHLMAMGGHRHVPVLRDGCPVGFASVRGILRYLAENALA